MIKTTIAECTGRPRRQLIMLLNIVTSVSPPSECNARRTCRCACQRCHRNGTSVHAITSRFNLDSTRGEARILRLGGLSTGHGERGSTSLYRGLGAEPPAELVQGVELPGGGRGTVRVKCCGIWGSHQKSGLPYPQTEYSGCLDVSAHA